MKNKIRMIIIIMSISFIGIGMYRGEVNSVLIKATNICLECIGIG